jgi:hypothetical protein
MEREERCADGQPVLEQRERQRLQWREAHGMLNDVRCKEAANLSINQVPTQRHEWWLRQQWELQRLQLLDEEGNAVIVGQIQRYDGDGCGMQFRHQVEEVFACADQHELSCNRESLQDTQRLTWLMGALKGRALELVGEPLKRLRRRRSEAKAPPAPLLSVGEDQRPLLAQQHKLWANARAREQLLLVFSLLEEASRLSPMQGAALFRTCRRLKGESVTAFAEKFRWQAMGYHAERSFDAEKELLQMHWNLCWEDVPLLRCMDLEEGLRLHEAGRSEYNMPLPLQLQHQCYDWHCDIDGQPTLMVEIRPDYIEFLVALEAVVLPATEQELDINPCLSAERHNMQARYLAVVEQKGAVVRQNQALRTQLHACMARNRHM